MENSNKVKHLTREMNAFRDCAYAFATACEQDGFGGVKEVDMQYISAALKMYKKVLKEFGDE